MSPLLNISSANSLKMPPSTVGGDDASEIDRMVHETAEKYRARSLPAMERAPISQAIAYIKSLQQESGGFSLMAGEDANLLMTGYALFALGIVGLDIKDSIVKSAIDYLEAVKAKTGAFGYHLDSSASLGPTAVIAHALDALGAPASMGLLQECKGYIAEWMSNGGWRETFSLDDKDTGDIETALTALCVFALGESLVPTQRREIIERILSIRNHDGGWGWSKGYPSDTDNTALALLALSQLSRNEDLDIVDLRPSLDHAVRYLLSCQNEDGGFRQRRAGEAAPMIDTTAIAAYALATVGRPTDEPVRRASRFLLRNQNEDGGWGNYPGMASDLDSTFYAIQALIAVGESIISVQDAEECLAELGKQIREFYESRVAKTVEERDQLELELKAAERKAQMLEVTLGIVVTIASIILGFFGF